MPRLVDDELFGRVSDGRIEDPDLIEGGLRSKSFATVVDLLGYGEISGFRNISNTNFDTSNTLNIGRDIFLDGTPLINANGDSNFQDVEVFFRSGTETQTPLSSVDSFGPDRIENTIPVNSAILEDFPVSKTITGVQDSSGNELIKILRVTVQIPALQEFVAGGDIRGTEVKISINILENDGTLHNVVVEDSINGKATSPYLKDYEIDLEQDNLQFPLTVTVIRNTPDSTETTLQNSTNFLSITTIITESRSYAGFAYVALRFNAQAFRSFPKRMYRIKGTKIQIPTGTTVDLDNGRIIYPSGYTFDGTFKTEKEWCSDPAWILYDLLTTDKGFGGTDGIIDADTLDVYSFYSASAYASTEITDPITGTTEPRFSCNVILNQKNDAYSLINDLCSVMNAMPFYSNGSLQISQDRPTNTSTNTSDPQYIFNNSNVTEEGFTYQGVGQRTKYTEVEVAYFDNDTQTIDYELITTDNITALSDSISKFGRTRKTLKAFACTSRGQANRLGRWFLYSNLKESEVVSFTTTLEAGVIVRPSTIIAIADSLRAGVRRGGRIKSVSSATITDPDTGATTNTIAITVDDVNNTDLTTANSATLSVVLSDGSVESRSIHSITNGTVTLSSSFSSDPLPNSVWAIENSSVNFQIYRVVSIEEKNDSEYTITAVIHDTNKYAQVEDTTVAVNRRNITTLLDEKPSPSNPSAIEQIVELNNRAVSKIFLSWEPVQGVKEYLVEFQFDNDNPERIRVARPSFEIFESRLGSYTFKIKSYNTLGKLSATTTSINLEAVGKTAPPSDVQNVQIEPLTDQFIRLRFDKSTDVDVIHGGNVIIRSSNLTTGASFTDSVDVIPELAGNISETIVSNIVNGTYFLAFRDDGGRISANAASIVNISTQPDIFPKITVLTDREDTDGTPFNGTKVRCFFDSTLNGLVLSSVLLDSVTDFNAIDDFNQLGNSVDAGGTYAFANTLDLGGKQPVILQRHLVTKGFYFNELFDDRLQNVNTWTDFDGTTVAIDVNAKLLVATTDSDPDTSTAGTYTINDGSGGAGTTITITKPSHGYSVGSFVTVDFTSGTGVDGDYQIQSVPTTGTFTLTSATSLSTSGDCNFSAEFSQFNPFVNGKYIARGFKFRCDMETKDVAQSIEIEQLGYTAQIESRTETSLGNAGASAGGFIASGTSTKSVTFTNSFFTGQSGTSIAANSVLPSIGITIENFTQGDFFVLSNITGTGFDIDVKDSGGNNVNRNFKYSATGFGRGS
jgi:predicted phage tail protein